ncbi:hypothetical protein [Mesorhizobium sp. SP-1A]|uniref:hypothetical protein n=1 Tax=Mesorhizobium sp. SP-1A TaxID=3077840 RepID=UPI0028F6F279|nr:hypothetical protein [Mesorhizobium sp. SP-1A]
MTEEAGPYVLAQGKVLFSTQLNTVEICDETDTLAVLYDVNDGILHKHGEKSKVSMDHERMVKAFTSGGYSEFAKTLELVEFSITPETIEELNACIGTTGRVLRFKERLMDLAEESENFPKPFGSMH